ncbi:MAG TPA: porin [Verrucomicrobiae bacterium]|nr:porin [Verrucomicrobiae bacterium]
MKLNQIWLATIAAAGFATASWAADGDVTTNSTDAGEVEALKKEIQALEQKVNGLEQQQAPSQSSDQVQELDQKVRVLERLRENDKDDAAAVAKTKPLVKLDSSGFTFSSADTNFVVGLHGLIQLDSRTFVDTPPGFKQGNDNFLLRRARPIVTGTVFHDFDFNFTPDFGGSTVQIVDAYLNYRYNQPLQLEAGKFKSPVGLEQLQSDTWLFFNERTLANNLVPNRDLGLELHGDVFGGIASYAAGVFDGTTDYNGTTANADVDNNVAFAGRVFLLPFKKSNIDALQGFGVGVGGSYQHDEKNAGNLTPGYRTDGQQTFFTYAAGVVSDGRHWRISPQGYYYYGPFGFLGEYVISDQQVSSAVVTKQDLNNTAWEISAGWVLTGEADSYNGVTPSHPFDLGKGQWGAWQVVARYAELNEDSDALANALVSAGSANEAKAWSVGLNWYLNRNIRANLSYSHTQFGDINGTANAVTSKAENVIFTRIQLAF